MGGVLVESLLGDELSPQVLDLKGELPFDGLGLLTHDVPPDKVKFVQDLGDAGLRHHSVELSLDFLDLFDSESWNPLVGIRLLSGISLLIGLNTEGVADDTYILLREILGLSEDLNIA